MENQLFYFKRGGSAQFVQGGSPSQTIPLDADDFGGLTDSSKNRFTVTVQLAAEKDRTKIGSGYNSDSAVAAGTVVTVPDDAIVDSGSSTLVIDTEAQDDTDGITLEAGDIVTVTFEPGLNDEICYPVDNLLSIRQDTTKKTELRFSGYNGDDRTDVITLHHPADKFAEVIAGVDSLVNATKRDGLIVFDAHADVYALRDINAITFAIQANP